MSRAVLIILITTSTFSLSACGQSDRDVASTGEAARLTAASLGEQVILSAKDYLAQDKYAAADIDRGETLAIDIASPFSSVAV